MALHRVNISAITSYPPKEYKMEDINGAWSRDWQESPNFTNIPAGGGYRCLARDAEGCVTERLIDYEPPLEITAYGAYIFTGSIGVTCAVNTPSEMRLWWDVSVTGEEYNPPPVSELNDMGWNNVYDMAHTRYLPYYYTGAIHHYWIRVRSKWGQVADVNGRYIITPETLDPIKPRWYINTDIQKISIGKYLTDGFIANNAFQYIVSSDSVKVSINTETSITKFTVGKNVSLSFPALEIKLTYTVS